MLSNSAWVEIENGVAYKKKCVLAKFFLLRKANAKVCTCEIFLFKRSRKFIPAKFLGLVIRET